MSTSLHFLTARRHRNLLAITLVALSFVLPMQVRSEQTPSASAQTFAPKRLKLDSATAIEIIKNAHRVAGGALWQRPKTLHMLGTAALYQDGLASKKASADHYEMWREYPAWNQSAHTPSGKVRIDAFAAGKVLFQVAFDGKNTYSQNGLIPGAEASKEWAEAFGFGIIRFALDKGFSHLRLADDLVDGKLCFVVLIHDPSGSQTTFWIDQQGFEIRKVGFDTPKGWHERVYSDFFRLANGWLQPGRVRLTYRGALSNDVRWRSAEVNQAIAPERFVITVASANTPK
jgi:hypothetical protein